MADAAVAAPADKKAPPKFKQRTARTFKSKAPKPGQKGWVAAQQTLSHDVEKTWVFFMIHLADSITCILANIETRAVSRQPQDNNHAH